jgi:iron only hydrogenase large subunit-like protein/nitrogen-specific signal transduction histidine kinase
MLIGDDGLVTTIKERCRRCFACVRECPAEAIRIVDGQASVIASRCIGCANCFRVCSQNAKQAYSDVERTFELLESGQKVVAIVAPSFPAEFTDIDEDLLVAMMSKLGFAAVHEVAFGADLVAQEYVQLIDGGGRQRYIATPCPAVVSFVRKYHPDLVPSLAPIVSPMIALSRVLHHDGVHGDDVKVVFIGPCIAKKGEAAAVELQGEIDAVLTFAELRQMFADRGITQATAGQPHPFDGPHGSLGSLFPLARGLLQAANLREDLMTGDIIAADGREGFVDAVSDFEHGESEVRLLDILACEGCIAGVGFSNDDPLYRRRAQISRHTKRRTGLGFDLERWEHDMEIYGTLDLTRTYTPQDERFLVEPSEKELRDILRRMNKTKPEDELNCGACGYDSCMAHAVAVYQGIAEVEMCLPYVIEKLSTTVGDLEESHRSLESTKEALVKSEKLASMGQLAAGIAHEVNNPLGILLLQANIVLEEVDQSEPMADDLRLIVDQANRCKKIISGLLNFARQSRVVRQPTDIVALTGDTLRTMPVDDSIMVKIENTMSDPVAEVDADQMVQVLTNLVSNARQAMVDGGALIIRLSDAPDEIKIMVTDTGVGIPRENMDKLFDPFFTTKQVGKGTGLGLAVTHGIVKMHRGQITVESNADPALGPTETTFIVTLPRHEL